jgi:hypothetical protein
MTVQEIDVRLNLPKTAREREKARITFSEIQARQRDRPVERKASVRNC